MRRRQDTRYQHLLLGDSEGIDEGINVGMAEGWPEDEGRRPHDESRMFRSQKIDTLVSTRKCLHSLLGDSDGIDDGWSKDDGRTMSRGILL